MKFSSALALSSVLFASAALAHHSGTMFDQTREVEVTGTVQEFQWTNPHTFIELMVDGSSGPYKFTVEGPTPGVLKGHGWKFNSLKSGDKITVKVHPLREAPNGGYLIGVTKNGAPIGDGGISSATIKGYK